MREGRVCSLRQWLVCLARKEKALGKGLSSFIWILSVGGSLWEFEKLHTLREQRGKCGSGGRV